MMLTLAKVKQDILDKCNAEYLVGDILDCEEYIWSNNIDSVYYGTENIGECDIEISPSRTHPKRMFVGETHTMFIGDDGCGNCDSYIFLNEKKKDK